MHDLKFGKDFVVTLHNDLVQARFTDTYTITEQKILFVVLSNIEPPEFAKNADGQRYIKNHIEEIAPFRVPIKEFTKWLGLNDPNYVAYEKAIDRLMKKVIKIQQQDGSWERFHWVSKSSYIAGNGIAEIKVDPEIYPYLLNLESDFTSIKLNTILNFKCKYSIRLYQLMKKWSKIGQWKIELDELKMLLGVPIISEKKGVRVFKLDKYSHFKPKVLLAALNEINELTEYNVEYEELKIGRKVEAINFIIRRKNNKALVLEDKQQKPKEQKNISKNDSKRYASELLEKYDYRKNSMFDKETGNKVYLDGLERIQLIILNRKNSVSFNMDDASCELLENELMKVINNSNFNISLETQFLFNYVDRAKSIVSPTAFILNKTRKLVESLLRNEPVAYKDLFKVTDYGKDRVLPSWWFDGEQSGNKMTENKKSDHDSNRFILDSSMSIFDIHAIRIALKLGSITDEELNERYDMKEYYRLDKEYGIEKIIEENELALV